MHWADYRAGTISRSAFVRRMAPVRRQVERLLLRGVGSGNRSIAGMCRELYDHRDWLWAFVRIEGVEPTNNASERALRQAVIWRKLSFGTQSADGSRFVETMLTVIETCRQQKRSALRVRHRSRSSQLRPSKNAHTTPQGVNGYDLGSLGADSAVPGLNRNIAYGSQLILPTPEILHAYDTTALGIRTRQHNSSVQSDTLAACAIPFSRS